MKKYILLMVVLIAVAFIPCFGQYSFQKILGNSGNIGNFEGYCVKQTLDGGYIVAGANYGYSTQKDIFIARTDSTGNQIWAKAYGGYNTDEGLSVEQTSDSGFIITGSNSSGNSGYNLFIMKLNSNGDSLWSKGFDTVNSTYGNEIHQTADGGLIITGFDGNNDLLLLKTDSNGLLLWSKTYGGTSVDIGLSVQQTYDGGYIAIGRTNSFGAGNYDVFVLKTDSIGNLQFSKTFGGAGDDFGTSIQQTVDSGYIVCGYTRSFVPSSNYNAYLIKLNVNGDTIWSKIYGGNLTDYAYSVKQTSDGGYVLCGTSGSFSTGILDVYVVKTDTGGNLLWSKVYGGTQIDEGKSIEQTKDGGYIITGYTKSWRQHYDDLYLIKTDVNGNTDCFQSDANTFVLTTATLVSNPSTLVSIPTLLETHPPVIIVNRGAITPICAGLGNTEISKTYMGISPNPSNGNFTIQFPKSISIGKLQILNLFGQTVYETSILNKQKMEIDLSSLSSGIYLVKVMDGEQVWKEKISVEK